MVYNDPKGEIMNLDEFDAKWAGDNGSTISAETPVDQNCCPACTADFHLC